MQKKILISIIVIVAVALIAIGGVFAYQYFSKPQTPNSNIQNELAPFLPQNSVPQVKGIKDCGIYTSSTQEELGADFKSSAALSCLGQNIANGCIEAKIAMKSKNDESLIEIVGSDFESCKMKMTSISSDYKELVNKYFECTIDKLIGSVIPDKIISKEEALKSPGEYAGTALVPLSFLFADTAGTAKKIGCTTNFIPPK